MRDTHPALAILAAALLGGGTPAQQYVWLSSPINGHQYTLTAPLDWPSAEAEARRVGGDLATVRDAAELAWITQTFGPRHLWIGLNDRARNGTYVWSSGEAASYRAWCPGEPTGSPREDVVHIANYPGWCVGRFNDQRARDVYPGLVERRSLLPTFRWTRLADLPQAASGAAAAFDRARGFGVVQPTFPPTTETWRFDDGRWLVDQGTSPPFFVTALRVACDLPGRGLVGLAAGRTWTFDGAAWTERSPASAPPALAGHALATDLRRGRVVCFGGSGLFATNDETWEWDGSTWTRRNPATAPGARTNHALAYDDLRGRVVLFGGFDRVFGGTALADTWEYDGTSWTRRSPANLPPARGNHALCHIEGTSYTVLFGGSAGGAPLGDTWLWDGSDWAQLAPPASPPGRQDHAMFSFPSRGGQQVVMVGGSDANGFRSDAWALAPVEPFASFRVIGTACGPRPRPYLTHESQPEIGTTFHVGASRLPANQPAYLYFGFESTFHGSALPVDLTPFGMRNCRMYAGSGTGVGFTTPASGVFVQPMAVPAIAPLVGSALRAQIFVYSAGANPLNVVTTEGGEGVFGH